MAESRARDPRMHKSFRPCGGRGCPRSRSHYVLRAYGASRRRAACREALQYESPSFESPPVVVHCVVNMSPQLLFDVTVRGAVTITPWCQVCSLVLCASCEARSFFHFPQLSRSLETSGVACWPVVPGRELASAVRVPVRVIVCHPMVPAQSTRASHQHISPRGAACVSTTAVLTSDHPSPANTSVVRRRGNQRYHPQRHLRLSCIYFAPTTR